MSEICPTTGFSKKSKERWPYLWGKLTNGQSNEFPNQDQIKSIDRGHKRSAKSKGFFDWGRKSTKSSSNT